MVKSFSPRWGVPMSVNDLQAGDVWVGNSETTIDTVETVTDPALGLMVRITGRITAGQDRSSRVLAWSFVPEQTLDIIRSLGSSSR